jgi:hypothetical protein
MKEDESHVYWVAILGDGGDLNGKSVREAAKHPLVSGTLKYCGLRVNRGVARTHRKNFVHSG